MATPAEIRAAAAALLNESDLFLNGSISEQAVLGLLNLIASAGGGLGGGATPSQIQAAIEAATNLDSIESTLTAINSNLNGDRAIATQLYQDATDTVYLRVLSYNQQSNLYESVDLSLSGSVYVPTDPVTPIQQADLDTTETVWEIVTAGTGYSAGDSVSQFTFLRPGPPPTIAGVLWYNQNSQAVIDAPPAGHRRRIGSIAATEATLTAINSSVQALNSQTEISVPLLAVTAVGQDLIAAFTPSQSYLVFSPSVSGSPNAQFQIQASIDNFVTFVALPFSQNGVGFASNSTILQLSTRLTIAANVAAYPQIRVRCVAFAVGTISGGLGYQTNTPALSNYAGPISTALTHVQGAVISTNNGVSDAGTLRVTLAAAAALSDATANPTTSRLGMLLHAFNGVTWDRLRSGITAVQTVFTGLLNAIPMGQFLTTLPTLGNGNVAPLQVSARGKLLVSATPEINLLQTGTQRVQINALGPTTVLVKATAGSVYGFSLINPSNAMPVYVKFFNANFTAAVTLGSTTPNLVVTVPASTSGGALFVPVSSLPLETFSAGIVVALLDSPQNSATAPPPQTIYAEIRYL